VLKNKNKNMKTRPSSSEFNSEGSSKEDVFIARRGRRRERREESTKPAEDLEMRDPEKVIDQMFEKVIEGASGTDKNDLRKLQRSLSFSIRGLQKGESFYGDSVDVNTVNQFLLNFNKNNFDYKSLDSKTLIELYKNIWLHTNFSKNRERLIEKYPAINQFFTALSEAEASARGESWDAAKTRQSVLNVRKLEELTYYRHTFDKLYEMLGYKPEEIDVVVKRHIEILSKHYERINRNGIENTGISLLVVMIREILARGARNKEDFERMIEDPNLDLAVEAVFIDMLNQSSSREKRFLEEFKDKLTRAIIATKRKSGALNMESGYVVYMTNILALDDLMFALNGMKDSWHFGSALDLPLENLFWRKFNDQIDADFIRKLEILARKHEFIRLFLYRRDHPQRFPEGYFSE
jgi:hypothetical protein